MKNLMLGLFALTIAAAARAETGVAVVKATSEAYKVSGIVTFQDTKSGLRVVVKFTGVSPGEHGFHIHEYGSCDEQGKAAGGHYNPRGVKHGNLAKDGFRKAHAGDFGNITADADGNAVLELVIHKESLAGGKYSVGGRVVILHDKPDDFTQPLGNAGARIACGLIAITGR